MLIFLEREVKIVARNWELVSVNILTSAALALVFSAVAFIHGLIAAVLISSFLYSNLLMIREEELGTLDGLRLLGRFEEYFAAKIATTAMLNLLSSSIYSAVYAAASFSYVDLAAAVYVSLYFGAVSTAGSALALATKSRQVMSLFTTSALALGFSASAARGGVDITTALGGLAFTAAAVLLSRELS